MSRSLELQQLPDVFRGSEARAAGLITAGQLRGPRVRRLFQDVYTRADIEITHELRCRGAALLAPKEAVLTGRSAATVMGVELASPYDPVEFVVPEKHRFGPIKGIQVRRTAVTRRESKPWRGIRIARSTRVALDLLLRLSPRARGWIRRLRIGVPDLDLFLRKRPIRRSALKRAFRKRRNRGIRLARHALALADPRAESLPESELRVVLNCGGLRPVPQVNVYRHRRFVGRLDLALKEEKVAIEYDGRWHQNPRQQLHDEQRRQRITEAGWTVVVVTADDLANDYAAILTRVRQAQRAQLVR